MASAHQHVKPKCPGETLAAQPLRTINSQRLGVASIQVEAASRSNSCLLREASFPI
jgi:hypothetical protein